MINRVLFIVIVLSFFFKKNTKLSQIKNVDAFVIVKIISKIQGKKGTKFKIIHDSLSINNHLNFLITYS